MTQTALARHFCAIAIALCVLPMHAAVTAPVQLAQKARALTMTEVQQHLKDVGFDPGPVDGTLNDRTIEALRAFQREAGVAVTGKLDDATMAELIASGEDKMLHLAPNALLPPNTALENFGTRVILRPAKGRKGVMVLVVPRHGGYVHKLQFLGVTQDGRAHVESTVWSEGAVHEFDEPITLAGYAFAPDAGKALAFRVNLAKGYVFVGGEGQVTPPEGKTVKLGAGQKGMAFGGPPPAAIPQAK